MELRHLRYFVTVAEELHFARAAERLQMAQQPLSVQIRRLEKELGVALFTRTTRRVELTEAGRVFLDKARQTLQLAGQAIEAAREAERGERGKITIGYVSTTLYNVMPPLIRAFRTAFPNISVTLRELCSPELDEQIIQGNLDIGLIGTPIQDNGLDCFSLCHEPVVVVLPESHSLAALPEIPLRKLADEPFIQYDPKEKWYVYEEVVGLFHKAGVPLNVVQEASSEQAMIGLAAAGIGVSLVSASLAGLRRTEVVYRRLIEPSLDVEFNMIWRRDVTSPVVQSFLQEARTQTFTSMDTLNIPVSG